jgi:hypothetical protein
MPETKQFTCDICGKTFAQEQSMLQHKRDAHQTAKQVLTKKSLPVKKILLYSVGILIVAGIVGIAVWAFTASSSSIGPVGSTHIHADIAIWLDGQQFTPFPRKYWIEHTRNQFVHIESGPGEGYVIHIHATNLPLGFFFKSLGWELTDTALKLDDGRVFANSGDKTLKVYVKSVGGDWRLQTDAANYVMKDLDKILITYGNETEEQIKLQQNSVTDFAKDNSATGYPR